jgi:hypothetical protein
MVGTAPLSTALQEVFSCSGGHRHVAGERAHFPTGTLTPAAGGLGLEPPHSSKHNTYFDVLDACKRRGCPICALALVVVGQYLDSIVYESVNDPPTRMGLVAARGYCNDHSWQLRDMRAGLGSALIYRDILRHVMDSIADRPSGGRLRLFRSRRNPASVLSKITARMNGSDAIAVGQSLSDPHTACPACQVRERSEIRYIGVLLEHIGEIEFIEVFRVTGGLCIVHLDQATAVASSEAALDRLLSIQVELMQSLDSELGEFLRKQDYRFRHEPMGSEGDSWIRALAMVAGQPGIR